MLEKVLDGESGEDAVKTALRLADLYVALKKDDDVRRVLERGLKADNAAPEIRKRLLALYEKQRTRYGTGASLLRGGVSLASGVKLLEDELQKIRAAAPDDVLICPSSDSILVRTDESGL